MFKLFLMSLLALTLLISCATQDKNEPAKAEASTAEWIPLIKANSLDGWFVRGKATWQVKDGVLMGDGGMGHIYANPVLTDLEVKGNFRVSEKGNSGLYFRANQPEDNPEGFPKGYESQIDNHQDAHTAWIWKPGNPSSKANKLITKDNEWFEMHVKAVGDHIEVWINGEKMTDYRDSDYTKGHFAIQGHNPGMTIEIKDLVYKDLSGK
jgi:hypothetical protein